MHRVLILLFIAILPFGNTAAGQPQPPPSATNPSTAIPPTAKTFAGLEVTIKIDADRIIHDEMDVLITYSCAADADRTHRIRNTSMSLLMDLPGDLVIRDAQGREVNRITDRTSGSRVRPSEQDYVSLSAGQFKATKVQIRAAQDRRTDEWKWIGNGEYTLQFEMHHAALGLKGERETPVVRSEPVKFRLGK